MDDVGIGGDTAALGKTVGAMKVDAGIGIIVEQSIVDTVADEAVDVCSAIAIDKTAGIVPDPDAADASAIASDIVEAMTVILEMPFWMVQVFVPMRW